MIKIGSGILCITLLVQCIPEPLPVGKIEQLKPKIVVSSQIIPDQSVVVLLTKSFGALDASDDSDPEELLNQIAINDALVIIEGMGVMDTLQFIDRGVYGSNTIDFVPEATYSLRVSSASMGKVIATTQVKTQATFESLSVKIYDTGFDTLAQVQYALRDLPGRNYYMFNVQHVSAESPPEPDDFLNPNVFTYLVQDNPHLEGQLISDSFKVYFRRDFIPGDTVMVQMANIHQQYFDFLKLREENRFNFSDFLGEPINYPSNVKGGLGWFVLHIPDIRIVTVEEE
jgi:hypothetical protein